MFKKKKFYYDIILNTMAFGIYIVSFHLLMMPYLARTLETSVNASLLVYIMISNILTLSLGNELGVLYQVLTGRRPGPDNISDLRYLMNWTNAILGLLMVGILWVLGFSPSEVAALTITTILTNIRFYIQGYLRQKKMFQFIGVGNLMYLAGVISAILIFRFSPVIYWLPLLLSEIFSFVYLYAQTKPMRAIPAGKSAYYEENRKEYLELVGATILSNIPNYFDKLLILPLLGDITMAVYYAGTVLSKMLFLVVNPINAVLLSWLSSDRDTDESLVIKTQVRVNMILVGIIFLISFPITYLMIRFLYPQFLSQVMGILVPLSMIAAFSISASLLRVVFLRYFDLKLLKYINLTQIVVFLVLSLVGAKWFGLAGFTYGVAISKVTLWLQFYVLLLRGSKKPAGLKTSPVQPEHTVKTGPELKPNGDIMGKEELNTGEVS